MKLFFQLFVCAFGVYVFQNCAPLGEAMKFSENGVSPILSRRSLRTSFEVGINYGWREVGADFGGNSTWEKLSISQDPEPFRRDFENLKAKGISLVRWWVFSHLRGDAIQFDASGTPVGLSNLTLLDLQMALRIAEENDIQIMFCLFSFDSFEAKTIFDVYQRSLKPVVIDFQRRQALMNNVIGPFARAVEQSPYRRGFHSWDIINEPEDAMMGPNKYRCESPLCQRADSAWGGDQFAPRSSIGLEGAMTHDQMETFIQDTYGVLRRENPDSLITLGSVSAKYIHAWKNIDVDFYQFHTYPHFNDFWPYFLSPEELGLGDKPVLIGEYPIGGMEGLHPAGQFKMLTTFFNQGFMGALAWDYDSESRRRGQFNSFQNSGIQELSQFIQQIQTGSVGASPEFVPWPPEVQFGECVDVDPKGDGWGWDGQKSCRL